MEGDRIRLPKLSASWNNELNKLTSNWCKLQVFLVQKYTHTRDGEKECVCVCVIKIWGKEL